MKFTYIAMILLICTAFTVFPAAAGEKYLSGEPEMSVAVSGTNEYEPGQDVTLTVIVQNTGTKNFKIIQSSIVDRDDNPDTAKLVVVSLDANGAPLTVKTDPQMIGDVVAGSSVNAAFNIKVDKYAAPGDYDLITILKYKYLYNADQIGQDSIKYTYKDVELPLALKVKVKSDLQIEVSDIAVDSMNVGAEGYITMDVKNIGHETGQNSVVKLTQADGSAIVPTDSSVYVGEFAPGDVKTVKFKAAVSDNGEAKNYPVLVSVDYKNKDGDSVSSDSETIGVDVGGKVEFKIVSEPVKLNPGQKGEVVIIYKNTGETTAYNAQARISAVDPFTSNDDTSYLGDIAPGETATGKYLVSVSSDATIKSYGIDTEIRYRDSLDNSQISDSMKTQVEIVKTSGMAIFTNPVLLTVLVFAIIGAGYFVWSRRKN